MTPPIHVAKWGAHVEVSTEDLATARTEQEAYDARLHRTLTDAVPRLDRLLATTEVPASALVLSPAVADVVDPGRARRGGPCPRLVSWLLNAPAGR